MMRVFSMASLRRAGCGGRRGVGRASMMTDDQPDDQRDAAAGMVAIISQPIMPIV